MVYPIPDSGVPSSCESVKANKNSIRKRKRKTARKARKNTIAKSKTRLVLSMSSWAEQFTAAATWQLKHQLAYWKAKAVSLEYENKILHDIIRQNCSGAPNISSPADLRSGPVSKMYDNRPETDASEEDQEEEAAEEEIAEEEEGNWEVSEEFIEFLKNNAKFKEDARQERERLKALRTGKSEVAILEAGPSEQESSSVQMKKLYGSNWKNVAALEMAVQSHFNNESDKLKPSYWPNIPLNFG